MLRVLEKLQKVRRHQVSRNATWILLGQGANVLLQAGYFVLLARLLGVREYGVFAGAFAVVNLITPYSTLGAGMLFMRHVMVDRARAAVYWGNSVAITAVATVLIAGVLFFAGPVLTKTHDHVIFVTLVLANCFFGQVASLGSLVFQTFEKMQLDGHIEPGNELSSIARPSCYASYATPRDRVSVVHRGADRLGERGDPRKVLGKGGDRARGGRSGSYPARVREGVGFSFAGTTQAAYNDVDKVMLSHYGLNRENGFYTLAYRVIDVATTPIVALDAAVLPRFFRLGHAGMPKVLRLAVKSAVVSVLMGAGIAVAVLLLAPLIPRIVGRDFSGALIALRWLCWIPLLRGHSPGNWQRPHRVRAPEFANGGHSWPWQWEISC